MVIENYENIDEFFINSDISYKDAKNLKSVLHHHIFTSVQKMFFAFIPYDDRTNKAITDIEAKVKTEKEIIEKFLK